VNRFRTLRIDLHQHFWPEPFVAALRARSAPPRLVDWTLLLEGEPPFAVDPAAHDPAARTALAAADGTDLVCLSPAASLGIDRLPDAEADALTAAWLEGTLALAAPFVPWAPARTAAALDDALRAGAIGLELSADRLAAPGALAALEPLLGALESAGRPLFVHPGPAGEQHGRPGWWAPVVAYVGQLHAAWWAWADGGRARFPSLRVCFAALAGLGPLHGERYRARGGSGAPVDPLTFVETSSYGTQGVDAVIRALGVDVVCHGSDRPYAVPAFPALGEAALHALRSSNPGRLLGGVPMELAA
jgi:6-methylsalicylate decarboxylase